MFGGWRRNQARIRAVTQAAFRMESMRRQEKYQDSLTAFREAAALDPGNNRHRRPSLSAGTRARRWAQGRHAHATVAELRQNPEDQRLADVARPIFWTSGSTREMEAWLAGLGAGQAESAITRRMRLDLALARGDFATVMQSAPEFSRTGEIRDNFMGVTARLAQGDVPAARELFVDGLSRLRKRIEQEPRMRGGERCSASRKRCGGIARRRGGVHRRR